MNKILIINTLYPPMIRGGAELSVKSIAEAFTKDYEVTVIASNTKNALVDEYVDGVRVIRIPAFNLGYYENRTKNFLGKVIWNILEIWNPVKDIYLKNLINRIKPDIIHTNNLKGLSVYVWKYANKRKIPLIHTLRDKWLLCSRHHMFRNQQLCKKRCLRCKLLDYRKKKLSQQVPYILGISQFILNEHKIYGYFKRAEAFVIYNAVDNFSEKPKDYNSQIRFGYLGTVAFFKGVEFLLKEFTTSKRSTDLYIGGSLDNEYAKQLKDKYESENIFFLGWVQPKDFFKMVDVLIVPSLHDEPFGRIVIEAFQQGVPVLASRRGGLPELVEEDITGWIFDPDISGALSQKLNQIEMKSEFETIIENCKQAGIHYSLRKMIEKYSGLYKKLLGSSGKCLDNLKFLYS